MYSYCDALLQVAAGSGCPNVLDGPDGLTVLYLACFGDASACDFAARARRQSRAPHRGHAESRWGSSAGIKTNAGASTATAAAAAAASHLGGGAGVGFGYVTVRIPLGAPASYSTYTKAFDVPLIDAPGVEDTFSITQCDGIHGSPPRADGGPLSCEGADAGHLFLAMLFVDPKTGNSSANSYNTFLACMTPHCSLLAVV